MTTNQWFLRLSTISQGLEENKIFVLYISLDSRENHIVSISSACVYVNVDVWRKWRKIRKENPHDGPNTITAASNQGMSRGGGRDEIYMFCYRGGSERGEAMWIHSLCKQHDNKALYTRSEKNLRECEWRKISNFPLHKREKFEIHIVDARRWGKKLAYFFLARVGERKGGNDARVAFGLGIMCAKIMPEKKCFFSSTREKILSSWEISEWVMPAKFVRALISYRQRRWTTSVILFCIIYKYCRESAR